MLLVADDVVQVGASTAAVWQVNNSSVQVRQGEEFSVTCVVTALTPIDVVRLVLRRPASPFAGEVRLDRGPGPRVDAPHGSPRSLRWTVADNYDVKEPFSSLPRYRLYHSYDNGVATSTLTYRGARRVVVRGGRAKKIVGAEGVRG